jgi:hypothetical protein
MIPLTALALAIACGDDDGDDATDSGDDGSTGGTGGGEQSPTCKGIYFQWNASQLEAAATTGACQEDTAEVCGRDLNTEAGKAGQACFADFPNDQQGLAGCVLDALKASEDPSPSDACLGCYIASIACVQERCLAECLGDPNDMKCVQCRFDKECTQEFFACSGLPSPVPPP